MNMTRLFLVELGAFSLLLLCLVGRQILLHELLSMKLGGNGFGSAEGFLLLAVTIVTGVRYSLVIARTPWHAALPGLGIGWVAVFAFTCAIYLEIKGVRSFRIKRK
jgi:hypothetical protein